MTRNVKLALGGLLVLGLLGGLLYAMRDGGNPPKKAAAPTTGGGAAARSQAPTPGRPGTPAAPGGPAASTGIADDPGGAPARTVRDHRDDPPRTGPVSPIQGPTLAAVRVAALPMIKQCAAPLRDASPPKKGHLFVTFKVTVRGGRVIAGEPKIQQREIDEPELVACVTKVFEQLSFDAPEGQTDGEDMLGMAFNVP